MSAGTDKPFYVYLLCRPNGEPFYVGMGSGDRLLQHERRAARERSHKASIIRSIRAQGLQITRVVLERFRTAAEAKLVERELIRAIGRRDVGNGPLANMSDGGDGVTGWSPEMRQAHAIVTSVGMSSAEVRAGCRAHMKRLQSDPTWVAARAAEIRAYWKRPENRAAQSLRVAARFADPDARAEHARRQRVALNDPSVREKMRLAKLGKKQSPELIAKRAAALRKPRRPGTGERIAAGKKAAAARRSALAVTS